MTGLKQCALNYVGGSTRILAELLRTDVRDVAVSSNQYSGIAVTWPKVGDSGPVIGTIRNLLRTRGRLLGSGATPAEEASKKIKNLSEIRGPKKLPRNGNPE